MIRLVVCSRSIERSGEKERSGGIENEEAGFPFLFLSWRVLFRFDFLERRSGK